LITVRALGGVQTKPATVGRVAYNIEHGAERVRDVVADKASFSCTRRLPEVCPDMFWLGLSRKRNRHRPNVAAVRTSKLASLQLIQWLRKAYWAATW